ncbi:MAG TPA: M23 family metallopeptidase [Thermoanaerobacterales bacterium]|nr:M23 family metallopeptidase [Thermoanaerobacterales bacterium]
MYYNYYEPGPKKKWLDMLDLKKLLVCIFLLTIVLLLKKIDTPFTNLVLSKIDYYVFKYTYDFKSLADTIKQFPRITESVPVFQQTTSESLILPVSGDITSVFGKRVDPILKVEKMHNGIDIAQKEGTPVKAVLDGVVVSAGEDPELGRFVKLDHGEGLTTVYAHMKDVFVTQNENVKQGFIIGTVGMSGKADSPHLHFEILKNDVPQDPTKWLKIP